MHPAQEESTVEPDPGVMWIRADQTGDSGRGLGSENQRRHLGS